MIQNIFLDYKAVQQKEENLYTADKIKEENIRFEFPNGFEPLRLIEECRALNCLDVSEPDNFDFMFDITMQMLVGKPVFIYFVDDKGNKQEIEHFVVTDRYMNLRGVDLIDEYPIIVNWLVEFIAGELAKKFPRSLEGVRKLMSEKNEERMKKMKKEEVQIKTSFLKR